MLPGLSIVIGAPGSGKTIFAETLVTGTGRSAVALVAARPDDPTFSMAQARRRSGWQIRHETDDIGRTLAGISGDTAVLFDSLPGWLDALDAAGRNLAEAEAELMAGLALCAAPVVVLTRDPAPNDPAPLLNARGALNLKLAARAGLVVNVIAGLPQVLKGTLP